MTQTLIRAYKKFDLNEVKGHVLICGDLTSSCGNCKAINLKLDSQTCPQCHTDFQYFSFRNVKHHWPKIQKLLEDHPDLCIVDYEDFSRLVGAQKAKDFLR